MGAIGPGNATEPDCDAALPGTGIMGDDGRDTKTLRRRALRSTTHFKIAYNAATRIAATKHWLNAIERSNIHCEKAKLASNNAMPNQGLRIHLNSMMRKDPTKTNNATGAQSSVRGAVQAFMAIVWSSEKKTYWFVCSLTKR